MKLGRLPIAIAAVVLLGAVAAGLVDVKEVLASEPTPTPTTLDLPELPDKSQPPAPPTERSTRGAGPEQAASASGQGAAYTWEDGDRTIRVVLQDDLVVQKTAANAPDDVVVVKAGGDSIVQKQAKHGQDSRPVFRSESGGELMTLPGGVLLALDPEWDQARVETFFSQNGISADRTSELGFIENGFLVKTGPGFPSLELANALAGQDRVLVSSPNWWREVGTQTADDHGDFPGTATPLPLGSSKAGRIDPGDERDVFKLDLSRASGDTDVWIYTTGDLNTVGELSGSGGEMLASNDNLTRGREYNFHIRAVLPSGVYYVVVSSFWETAGDYTLHARTATDAGSTTGSATRLSLDSPTTGTIDATGDADYFRLDLTESTNLILNARTGNSAPIDGVVLDTGGAEISVNLYPVPKLVHPTDDRVGFRIEDAFGPGTYYIRVTTAVGTSSHPAPYTIHIFEDTDYPAFIEECGAKTRSLNDSEISDPLYGCQWHLNNLDGEDINVESIWAEGNKGEGINIAVVDDGMYYTHEDLKDNVDAGLNHDYTGGGDIHHPLEHHGTNVAGVIAARDNDIGVRGVAPRATIYGYNYVSSSTSLNRADAMARNRDVTAVSNNSWGPRGGPGLGHAGSFWELAVKAGVETGYDGKGVFYAFGGGNGHEEGDNANLNELANYHGVTAVCAVNDGDTRSYYSEMGANLWVCAPSSGGLDYRGIVTAENYDRYVDDFGGTSSATPTVSGVAALMRNANPDLTWRDLKLILAASARKNDAGNSGWTDGAHKYGSESDTDRYHFNHEYGFGVVDAGAAVDLAKGWSSLPPVQSSTVESGWLNTRIPDARPNGETSIDFTPLTVDTGIEFTEFVEVRAAFQHGSFRDLSINLVSPSGAVSRLVESFDTFGDDDPSTGFVPLHGTFRFGSARHLGEDPNGQWTLVFTDRIPIVEGTLESWSLTIYGHGPTPGPPTVDSVTAGAGSLTVAWTVPGQTGGAAVTAYDLRHIQTVVDETVDSNWTVVDDVWTATGGDLEYAITGLVGGAQYDLQVRAISGSIAGPWSTTVTGTPIPIRTNACATGRAVSNAANNPGLVSDCNSLLAARDALAGSAALNWSASTSIADWDGVTVSGRPRRVTELDLSESQLTGAIPTELGRLANLRGLYLYDNQLTGVIPTELGSLANLQALSLWGNRLGGPIPAELGRLANLRFLLLSGSQLTGPIPASLGDLANLEWLYLYDSQLTGPIPAELGDLANLQRLVLYRNELTGPVPAWLGDLANLQQVVLSQNQLTGPIPTELGGLTSLQRLLLWGNELTGPIPSELGNPSNLEDLYLSRNQLTGPIPSELVDLANLEVLSLWQNQLTGPIPTEFGDLANLIELSLSQNQLTGPIPTELGSLVNLELLYLSSNQLTGPIPAWLGDLTKLQRLSLSRNRLTGPIPTELGDLSNLEELYLGGNRLVGCILEGLRDVADNDLHDVGLPFCDVLLSGLVINPGSLIPPFDSDRTDYTAVVGQSRVTVTPTNDHSATVQLLDQDRNEIADADGSLAGHQVDLGADITMISIRVISEDGRAIHVYTIQVSRASAPGAPVISGITPGGGSLTVSWTPPSETGGADIASYDLRHIESAAADKSDPYWTVVDDAWTGGPLSYTLTGLTGGAQYNVQVRAFHGAGAGPWSATAAGTPATASDCATGGAVSDAADNPGLVSDCEALLAARDVLAVSATLNWSADTAISDWDGVTLRGTTARVRYLDLRDRGLGGSIPADLDRLSNLTYLNLRRNDLTGPIPTELDSLTNLRVLNLHSNELSGTIPDLSSMTHLQQLYLANNSLNGGLPEWLGDMTNVKELWLWGNELSGPIPNLSGMTALDRLKLQDNKLTGGIPAWFGEMTNLRYLYLHRNPLRGTIPPELGGMTKLRYVWLHSNELTGEIPEDLGNLDNLWDLNLHTNALEGSIPSELGDLSSLTHLRLHRNELSGPIPGELGNLSSLKFMWLHGNQLTGEIPAELGNLAKLQRLYLSENQLTGDIPAELDNLADTLTHWRLAGNRFKGCVPAGLAAVENNDLDQLGLETCTDN